MDHGDRSTALKSSYLKFLIAELRDMPDREREEVLQSLETSKIPRGDYEELLKALAIQEPLLEESRRELRSILKSTLTFVRAASYWWMMALACFGLSWVSSQLSFQLGTDVFGGIGVILLILPIFGYFLKKSHDKRTMETARLLKAMERRKDWWENEPAGKCSGSHAIYKPE